MSSIRLVLTTACASIASVPPPAIAQSFEGTLIQSWSDADRLSSPTGFGVAFVSPYRGVIAPRVGYTFRSDGGSRLGRACPSFHECPEEQVEDDVTLHSFDAGVNARLPVRELVEARIGLAVQWHSASGEIVGRETDAAVDLGRTGALGFVLRLGTEWEPKWARGASILAEARLEQTLTGECATESYVPFCEDQVFLSLAGGIAAP